MQVLELFPCALGNVEFLVETVTKTLLFLVHRTLTCADIGVLCALFLHALQFGFELFQALGNRLVTIFDDCIALFEEILLELWQVGVTTICIDRSDEVRSEVDDLFELLGLQLFLRLEASEKICQP